MNFSLRKVLLILAATSFSSIFAGPSDFTDETLMRSFSVQDVEDYTNPQDVTDFITGGLVVKGRGMFGGATGEPRTAFTKNTLKDLLNELKNNKHLGSTNIVLRRDAQDSRFDEEITFQDFYDRLNTFYRSLLNPEDFEFEEEDGYVTRDFFEYDPIQCARNLRSADKKLINARARMRANNQSKKEQALHELLLTLATKVQKAYANIEEPSFLARLHPNHMRNSVAKGLALLKEVTLALDKVTDLLTTKEEILTEINKEITPVEEPEALKKAKAMLVRLEESLRLGVSSKGTPLTDDDRLEILNKIERLTTLIVNYRIKAER